MLGIFNIAALSIGLVKLEYRHNGSTTTSIELISYSVSEKDMELIAI